MNILLTGATGFVGLALVEHLLDSKHHLRVLVREFSSTLPREVEQIIVGNLESFSQLDNTQPEDSRYQPVTEALQNIEVIVHMAARVHVMDDKADDSLRKFREINTLATVGLARRAASAGVKRFIFLSTIKVNGEFTAEGEAFIEEDICQPTDPYAISKWEAEKELLQLARETSMEVVIIRPPLIYGPGVKGNFQTMMNWVNKGVPLPFGSIDNKRSLLALDNLVSFIMLCLEHPKAANELFLLSDGEDVSTKELISKLAGAMHRKVFLLPISASLMKKVARMLGKESIAERLFGSLQVDSKKAYEYLRWKPIVSMDEQLEKMLN